MSAITTRNLGGRPVTAPDGPMVPRQVRLCRWQDQALRELSATVGIPVNELVRRAVESLLTPKGQG